MPIYPDEPLPFMEARELAGLDLSAVAGQLKQLDQVQRTEGLRCNRPGGIGQLGGAQVQNPRRCQRLSPMTPHLPILMPSMWLHVNLKSPNIAARWRRCCRLPPPFWLAITATLAGWNHGHGG